MSGTQTLVEVVLNLPENKREAWRALPAATTLKELADLPADHGRLELAENKKSVTARAFFCVEAEHLAERLIAAFRSAAALGASGKGVSFLLVDYQREGAHALTIGEGTSTLDKMPAGKARAKHAALDALLERCVVPPAPAPAPSDEALERAFRAALATLRTWPADAVGAAWQRVKSTTMTNAAFAVTKKQEKQLLALVDEPPAHWQWAKVLPLRMVFPRESEAMESVLLDLLDRATLTREERWMALESLCDSSSDVALERLQAAMRGEHFLAAAARLALAASVHPNATAVIVKLAEDWLERALRSPELLPAARDVFTPGAPPNEPMDFVGLLGMRADAACDATLLRIWQELYEARARLSQDAASVAVLAAQTYIRSASRALDPVVAQSLLQRLPHVFVPLEHAKRAIDELHELVPR